MNEVEYNPRLGSVCYRAFEHLEAFGPTTEQKLADACDVDVSSLRSSVNLAVQNNAMKREAKGGALVYESIRKRPPIRAAEGAAAPSAPAEPQAAAAPVAEPPPAAPPTPWTPPRPLAPAPAPAAPAPAPVAVRLDDIQETPAQVIESEASRSVALKRFVEDTVQAMEQRMSEGLQARNTSRPFEFALWSDGRLSMELDGLAFNLNAEETRKLLDYLDRMRVEEEPARG